MKKTNYLRSIVRSKLISRSFLAIILFSLSLLACSSSDDVEPSGNMPTAKTVVKEMGAGFNIGNVFDNGIQSTEPSTMYPIIDLYAEAGMTNVRIPVTWGEGSNAMADAEGNVNFSSTKFIQLKKVIDYALDKGLYVMINAHHEHWLKDYYDGSAQFDNRFANIWSDVANYFIDYDHHLIFEVLNEPEGMLGEDATGFPSPDASTQLAYTRQINEVGYQAIRNTGGNNATRIIMVSPNAQGNSRMLSKVYPTKAYLPGGGNDKYLAAQVHSYDPWSFCGQTGSNSNYPGNTSIQGAIHPIVEHAQVLDIPLNYGEFGVGRDGNQAERNTETVRGYYKTFAQKVLHEEMSFCVWDDRGWFGLVTESGNGYDFLYNIVPYMLGE